MKILLAVDGSACSDHAVASIASRPWPAGSEIRVITAYETTLMPRPEVWVVSQEYSDEMQRAAREYAQDVANEAHLKLSKALGDSLSVTSQIVAGPAKSIILEHAELWGADLIVVGSHGHQRWERFLLGSVSQAVVSHAKCSVEVIRCVEHQAEEPKAA